MAVLNSAMKAVLMNHSSSRDMAMNSSVNGMDSLPCPVARMMSPKLLSVALAGMMSGGSFTVEVAGVSAVLNIQ